MAARPPHERVLARVEQLPGGCLRFTGALNHGGYGVVQLGRGIGTDKAHRVVYRALVGEIPDGMTLDHTCHLPACVNTEHLEVVTRAENARRQWRDGKGNPENGNQEKTHCPRGHPYDDANTYRHAGRRHCRACGRERRRAASASPAGSRAPETST